MSSLFYFFYQINSRTKNHNTDFLHLITFQFFFIKIEQMSRFSNFYGFHYPTFVPSTLIKNLNNRTMKQAQNQKRSIFTAGLLVLVFSFNSCIGKTTNNTFKFSKYSINYQVYGDGEKTLVFIHGWSSNTEVWRNQLTAYPNYKVIAIDLPGHGLSSKDTAQNYTINLLVNSVKEVLDNEEIKHAFIFGHSMGFAIAEVFNLKYPETCMGIASIDGAHFELPTGEQEQNEWIRYNHYMASSVETQEGKDYFISSLFLESTPIELKKEIIESAKETPLSIGSSIIYSMTDSLYFWEKRVEDIPCLAIHSPVYKLSDQYKSDFMTMYPKAQYIEIDNVSHFLMLEVPEKLNQIIHDYLKDVY